MSAEEFGQLDRICVPVRSPIRKNFLSQFWGVKNWNKNKLNEKIRADFINLIESLVGKMVSRYRNHKIAYCGNLLRN